MKKIVLLIVSVFAILTLIAQPRFNNQRPLPNQFRDFVDHQQRIHMERPKIEKKDGKVIITMSEEQFERMQDLRRQRMRMIRFNEQPVCQKCKRHHGKPHRKKV